MSRPLAAILVIVAAVSARADEPAKLLDAAPSRFATHDGARVHYKSIGTGETALVFVHGWTCDHTFWFGQVPTFAGKAPLLLIDLPGHGKSDKPEVDYTMDRFARAVAAVMDDAGVRDAVLAGHSMGTPVVRQFYRLFPDRTRGLIAVDGSLRPFGKPEQQKEFAARFSGPDALANRTRMIEAMFTPAMGREIRKHIKDGMLATPPHVAAGAMKGMTDPAVWGDDPIKVPLLALMAKSPNWSGDYEAYVRKLAPQVDYRVMDGVGHFLMMEKPDHFNFHVTSFWEKVMTSKWLTPP